MVWLARRLRDYARLATLVGLVLLGVQVPGFIDQYHDTVVARLSEAQLNLQPYQRDAERYTKGDLNALIQRYVTNSDAAIVAGGNNLQRLMVRVEYLSGLETKLNTNGELNNAWLLVTQADGPLLTEAYQRYDYRIQLTPNALAWGIISALFIMTILELMLASLFGLVFRSRPTTE